MSAAACPAGSWPLPPWLRREVERLLEVPTHLAVVEAVGLAAVHGPVELEDAADAWWRTTPNHAREAMARALRAEARALTDDPTDPHRLERAWCATRFVGGLELPTRPSDWVGPYPLSPLLASGLQRHASWWTQPGPAPIGAWLRERRVTAGLSIAVASRRVGLDPTAWARIERGETGPTLGSSTATLERMLAALGARVLIDEDPYVGAAT